VRKLISLGLFALIISIFSSQLLAAKTGECDGVTKKNGLYGLCVAWHNADDKAKDKIAAKFFERAKYRLPGSEDPVTEPDPTPDFFCPCWTDVSMADVCSLGSPSLAMLTETINVVIWKDEVTGLDKEFFYSDAMGCIYDGQFVADEQVLDNLTDEETLDCMAEIESIAAIYNGGSCN